MVIQKYLENESIYKRNLGVKENNNKTNMYYRYREWNSILYKDEKSTSEVIGNRSCRTVKGSNGGRLDIKEIKVFEDKTLSRRIERRDVKPRRSCAGIQLNSSTVDSLKYAHRLNGIYIVLSSCIKSSRIVYVYVFIK